MNDVMDFYDITFKDNTKKEYWHDDRWKETSIHIEKIKIRDSETILDTTLLTHHGPMLTHDIFSKMPRFGSAMSVGRAMRWLATEPSMEPKTFYMLNKAKNSGQNVISVFKLKILINFQFIYC